MAAKVNRKKPKFGAFAANAEENYQKLATRMMVATALPVKKSVPNTQLKRIMQLEKLHQPTTYGIIPDLMRATPEQLMAYSDAFAVAKNRCVQVGDYARAHKFDWRERWCQQMLRGMLRFTLQ